MPRDRFLKMLFSRRMKSQAFENLDGAPRTRVERHPAELRLLVAGTILLIAAIPIVSATVRDAVGVWWVTFILTAIVGLYVGRGLINAAERARSVLVTEEQFPEVYERIVHFSREFGLRQVPDAYIVQEGGTLNAFASKHNRANFIRINSDILEVGSFGLGPRPQDPEALDFIVAHEVGHVAASHVTYWYTLLSNFIAYIPIVGTALSRAKEYTADNYGYAMAPGGVRALALLSGGKYLYTEIDHRQFVERAGSDRGFFLWLFNALASHPILTKRIAAIEDRSKPGKLF